MEDNSQKTLAIILIFFLLLIYKTTVWDPYYAPQKTLSAVAIDPKRVDSATELAKSNLPANIPVDSLSATNPTQALDKNSETPIDLDLAASEVIVNPSADETNRVSASTVTIHSNTLNIDLSLLGGRIVKTELNQFSKSIDNPHKLDLVGNAEGIQFVPPLGIYTGKENDSQVVYNITSSTTPISQASKQPSQVNSQVKSPATSLVDLNQTGKFSLTLSGQLPSGIAIAKTLTFYPDGYLIDLDVSVMKDQVPVPFALEWTRFMPPSDPSFKNAIAPAELVWFEGKKALRAALNSITSTVKIPEPLKWATIADTYFLSTLAPVNDAISGTYFKSGYTFGWRLQGDTQYRLYIGPKDYEILEQLGSELARNVNLGWTGFVAAPLLSLLHILYTLLGNYGPAIVLLTIVVKLLIYPITQASFKQMKAMQTLGPEIQKLKESIPDKQQQQQEILKLYQKKGVNPMGGCLPILIQLPVFIGLYTALSIDVQLRHAPFAFWINDLSAPERLEIFGIGIPVLVILMIALMMLQQWITPTTADPLQKKIMMAVPVFMGFLFIGLPAGLTIYILTNSAVSIAQSQGLYSKHSKISGFALTLYASVGVFLLSLILAKLG